mgnify:CR=1 FL=1
MSSYSSLQSGKNSTTPVGLTMVAYNESGYVTSDLFAQYMQEFVRYWYNLYCDTGCRFFVDNLGAHKNVATLPTKELQRANIELAYLPKNTTHFTQPLDDIVFAIFKSILNSDARAFFTDAALFSLDAAQVKKIRDNALYLALAYAEGDAFTRLHNIMAFERTCLFPWNPERLLEKARANASLVCPTHVHDLCPSHSA